MAAAVNGGCGEVRGMTPAVGPDRLAGFGGRAEGLPAMKWTPVVSRPERPTGRPLESLCFSRFHSKAQDVADEVSADDVAKSRPPPCSRMCYGKDRVVRRAVGGQHDRAVCGSVGVVGRVRAVALSGILRPRPAHFAVGRRCRGEQRESRSARTSSPLEEGSRVGDPGRPAEGWVIGRKMGRAPADPALGASEWVRRLRTNTTRSRSKRQSRRR